MKKIIFVIFTLFIFISNSSALSKFYLGERIPNMHIETVSDSEIHNGVPFILRRDDGEFVYCLEQQKKINTTNYYYEYKYNHQLFNLTNEQLNKINLIAYYGYNYKNHSDIKWYGITQFVIWKTLNYKDIYFTDTAYGNKIIAYESEIKEIEQLVDNHSKLPSFSNKKFEYTINKSYVINDLNEVLSNYEIKNSNIESRIEKNTLYIDTEKEGNYEITFIRKNPIKRDYILYELSGSQPLIYPGRINDIEFKINIEVSSGSITVNKLDSNNINRSFATLEGAVYGIFDDNELITTINTDQTGIAYIDKIPLGKYYVKEITPSIGYKLDEQIYEIYLTQENKDVIITSYEEIIKGDLTIKKYYGEESNYKLEDGAIFEIYDINDKLIGTYETENGVISIKLDYGKYYILQKKGIDGYKIVDKKYISILEEKKYELNLYDEIIKGNLIINKYYGEENDYRLEDGAIFEIYDINNSLVGSYETENGKINKKLKYGEYYVVQKEGITGYKFIDRFNISIKEEKDYIYDLYNLKEEILVVEVPDTKRIDYHKFVPIIFIILGIILVLKSQKKTTQLKL